MVGWPNAVFRITLAVLRPTPGSASSASRLSGTSPPYCSIRILHVAITFFAFVRNNPMVLMYSVTPSSPSASTLAGVLATGYMRRIALFTETSVACADSITEISNSNGDSCSSSVVGCGFRLCSVSKIARRFVGFIVFRSCFRYLGYQGYLVRGQGRSPVSNFCRRHLCESCRAGVAELPLHRSAPEPPG